MDIVIGLIGAKKAGKTTAFEAIRSVMDVQEITLADKLKNACAEVFQIPRFWFDSHSVKEKDLQDYIFLNTSNIKLIFNYYGIKDLDYDKHIRPHIGKVLHSPRTIAQYIGTEVLRAYDTDIHCNSACQAITKNIGVVTDMRFPNEYEYFAKHYGAFYPVYIQNVGAEVTAGKDTHASEAHLYDLAKRAVKTIPNNGSIAEFHEAVRQFLKEFVR